jgi:hypothetical protein
VPRLLDSVLGFIARLLRDLTALVEGAASAELGPGELTARLADQLGREPTPAELRMLLEVVRGLQGSLSLDGTPPEARERLRTTLTSYAEGLRRDLGNATRT